MFLGNSKIENALKIINEIEDGKFPLLLNRIAQFLCNSSSDRPFTPVEETKLETSLEITKAEVETLINGIIEIFLVSAYCVLKPSLLGEQLGVLHLNAKKAEIFVQVWAASAKGIVDNLKQKNFFPQLDHISYSISVKTASESVSKEKSPKAQLQLNLSSVQKTEDINLEFNHEELCELYKKLEQVQGQLDALSATQAWGRAKSDDRKFRKAFGAHSEDLPLPRALESERKGAAFGPRGVRGGVRGTPSASASGGSLRESGCVGSRWHVKCWPPVKRGGDPAETPSENEASGSKWIKNGEQ